MVCNNTFVDDNDNGNFMLEKCVQIEPIFIVRKSRICDVAAVVKQILFIDIYFEYDRNEQMSKWTEEQKNRSLTNIWWPRR